MDADAVFNRYDIRGTYPDEIDETFAERIGKAAGTYAIRESRGTVVVGRDTRESSDAVHTAFIDGIRSTGADVVDVGVGTTDRTALAANHYGGIGVMVTASHHAWKRTGFKFLYEQGHGFSNDELDAIHDLFEEQQFERGDGTKLTVQDEFDETYIEAVQSAVTDIPDTDLSATVVLDAVGGTQRTAAWIFEELGATVIEVERDERPEPEPTPDTRQDVHEQLDKTDADIAVGYDPDGDRVYVIHPDYGWIDGNQLFYMLGVITGADSIVASIDTAPPIEQLGADVTYTRVGDVFVAEKGVDLAADLLGEPNGHYAVTDFCWYNSGIFASLLLTAYHGRFDTMLADTEDYVTHRFVQTFDSIDDRDTAMTDVKKQVAQQFDVVSTMDGLKFEGDGFTGLVRPSGTSPKIRLIVHAEDADVAANQIQDHVFQ
jgi:phosphoglucosamine mutase